MQEWSAPIVAILGAGGGAIILELTKRGIDAASGRGRKRRDEVDRAWTRADSEAQKRRIAEEHASHVRRLLIEAPCIDNAQVPQFPAYPSRKD